MMDAQTKWIPCPKCGANTRTKVRPDTQLYHHLIFCRKCKTEYLVNVKNFAVTVVPDAQTQCKP